MTSKERVKTVLDGKIPDQVPIGEFAIDFDTVEKIIRHETYHRAKAKSQIAFWEGRRDEVVQSWQEDFIELQRKLGLLDIITFPDATWAVPLETDEPPPKKINQNTWEDTAGRIYRYSDITADITCIEDPTQWTQTFSREQFSGEIPAVQLDPISFQIRDRIIETFKNEKYICTPFGGEIGITFLGGLERGCVELIEHPEIVKDATQFFLKTQNAHDALYIHPAGDAVLMGQDFAATTGPFISPEMFRDFFLEPNRVRVAHLHNKYDVKILKHACGNNWKLLDMFLEIGYDAYQSIQPTAEMDIRQVKQRYGEKITLWGGVAVENLISGTPQAVRDDVQYAMRYAKPGGRFILGASHSIAVGTKYENYMAMLDEFSRHAAY